MPQLRLSHLGWLCLPILLILTSHLSAQSLSEPNNPNINWLATFWMLIAAALVFFILNVVRRPPIYRWGRSAHLRWE